MAGTEASLSLPLRVDAFTLERRIGAGAMGEVYLAREDISGREVAVKVMARKLVGNQRAEARFRREISAMGVLRHPGIPAFAGWGEVAGLPYLAMEFIRGHSLDAFVAADRPLPEDLALWVAIQLAEVIGHCHRETGMIHRDLKPGNVMVDLAGLPGLSEQSRLKILDFGLATYIDFGDFEDFAEIARGYAEGHTFTGEVMGTPAYMSPEQIRGEKLTFQSDIYAIGSILHHLLTGHLPYEGSSVGVVMSKHLDAPVPDPGHIVPVRPATTGVVQRAMAKSPQARFRSYNQFVAVLQAARYSAGQATRRYAIPGERREQPTTRGTEAALQRPPSAAQPRVDAPAVPSPPGSSVGASWRRPDAPPVDAAQTIEMPSTSAWRRPGQPAAPPPAAPVEPPPPSVPTTSAWRRPPLATPPPPAMGAATPALPPAADPPTTSAWRRPVRTPPPVEPPPAGGSPDAPAAEPGQP